MRASRLQQIIDFITMPIEGSDVRLRDAKGNALYSYGHKGYIQYVVQCVYTDLCTRIAESVEQDEGLELERLVEILKEVYELYEM